MTSSRGGEDGDGAGVRARVRLLAGVQLWSRRGEVSNVYACSAECGAPEAPTWRVSKLEAIVNKEYRWRDSKGRKMQVMRRWWKSGGRRSKVSACYYIAVNAECEGERVRAHFYGSILAFLCGSSGAELAELIQSVLLET